MCVFVCVCVCLFVCMRICVYMFVIFNGHLFLWYLFFFCLLTVLHSQKQPESSLRYHSLVRYNATLNFAELCFALSSALLYTPLRFTHNAESSFRYLAPLDVYTESRVGAPL